MNEIQKQNITSWIDFIKPDTWNIGGELVSPSANDVWFFGPDCKRLKTNQNVIPSLPVRITVTGRKVTKCSITGRSSVRVKVEFLDDNGESFVKDHVRGTAFFG